MSDFKPYYRARGTSNYRGRRYSNASGSRRSRTARAPRSYKSYDSVNDHDLSPLAAGVIAPFDSSVQGKVTPGDVQGVPTLKVSAKAVGVMTCNDAGNCQCLIIPTTANDYPSFQVTGALGVNTVDFYRPVNSAITDVTDGHHNGPFTGATLLTQQNDNGATGGNAFEYESRMNVIGIRITPTGPVLNRSGTVYIVRPGHGTDVSYMTAQQYMGDNNTHSIAVSEMPVNYEYAMTAFNFEDTELSDDFHSWVSPSSSLYYSTISGTVVSRAAVAGIKVVGCTAGFTFRIELIYHMEFSGPAVASIATPTCSDHMGTVNALALASDIDKNQKSDPTVHRSAVAEISHAARAVSGPLSMAAQAGVPGASTALSVAKLLGSKQGSTAIGTAYKVATKASKMLKLKL